MAFSDFYITTVSQVTMPFFDVAIRELESTVEPESGHRSSCSGVTQRGESGRWVLASEPILVVSCSQ